MTTFDLLIRAGWGYVIVAKIEGIPYVFAETIPKRADSASAVGLPADVVGVIGALYFGPGVCLTQELDRETGVSRGDSVDLTLTWEPLEDAEVLPILFARPSRRTRLTSDIDGNDTTWQVDSTTGWTAGDLGYIGRELVTIDTVVDADTLEVVRGVLSQSYLARASSPSTFSHVTDRPEVWTGRTLRLYRHILSPEGRMLDSTWCSGTYCEPLWLGYLDAQPRETALGMVLRALPLQRIADRKLGYEVGLEIAGPNPDDLRSFGDIPIVVGPESYIRIEGEYSGTASGTFAVQVPSAATIAVPYVDTIGGWARTVQDDLNTALAGEPWFPATGAEVGITGAISWEGNLPELPGQLAVKVSYDAGGGYDIDDMTLTVRPGSGTYWLVSGQQDAVKGLAGAPVMNWLRGFPTVAQTYPEGSYLPVWQVSGQGYQDLAVPASGVAVVEVEGAKELIRWDATEAASAPADDVVLLHVVERGVAGTPRVAFAAGAKLSLVSGHDGPPSEALLTLLESSGVGDRGTYDTMGLGFGAGIDDGDIDEAGILAATDLGEEAVAAYADGRASLEDLLGGWLALSGLCLVQRLLDDGTMRLALVRVDPTELTGDDYTVINIEAVELSGVGDPETIDATYEVQINRSGPATDAPDVIVRDVPAIQQGAQRAAAFTAPGISESSARSLAEARIALGLGQTAVQIAHAPWLRLQVGDAVSDETAHPSSYDWSTGARAPAQRLAVVAGTSLCPFDGRRVTTLLRAGILAPGRFLCPVATVTGVVSVTQLDIDVDVRTLFDPDIRDITLRLYNRGVEGTEMATADFEIVSASRIRRKAGSHPAWVAVGTRITMANIGAGNNASVEPSYLFQVATRSWGA